MKVTGSEIDRIASSANATSVRRRDEAAGEDGFGMTLIEALDAGDAAADEVEQVERDHDPENAPSGEESTDSEDSAPQGESQAPEHNEPVAVEPRNASSANAEGERPRATTRPGVESSGGATAPERGAMPGGAPPPPPRAAEPAVASTTPEPPPAGSEPAREAPRPEVKAVREEQPQTEVRQSESRQVEARQSEASQAETRQTETRQTETRQTETRQAETRQTETRQTEARQTEVARPTIERSGDVEVERAPRPATSDARAGTQASGLTQTPGSEVLREAATDQRGDSRTGDEGARQQASAPAPAPSTESSGATPSAEGFAASVNAETAAVQAANPGEALANATRSDAPIQTAVAQPTTAPIESAVAVEEPAPPTSTARPLPAEAIPQHIEWLAARGGGTAQIQLYPPELGKLAIQVTVRGEDVQVVMNVREAAAQTVVAEYRDSLENALTSKDLKLDGFEVRDWRDRKEGDGGQQQPAGDRDRGAREGNASDSAGIAGTLAAPPHVNANSTADQAQNVNLHV